MQVGSTQCTKCPNGTASRTDKSACNVCAPGSFATSGAAAVASTATASSGCTACPSGKYQPDAHQSACLACESKSDDATLYAASGINATAGTGATICEATSVDNLFLNEPWVRTAAAGVALILACALVCCVCGRCFTSTTAGKRCARRFCGYRGNGDGFDTSDSSSSDEDCENDDDGSLYLSRRREGRYMVTSKVLEVFETPNLNARRVGPPKERGDLLVVEANSDDWLLLADDEGWVLGFHPTRGARVAKLRNRPSPRTGKATKTFRSRVHEHIRQQKRQSHASKLNSSSSSTNLTSQNGSIGGGRGPRSSMRRASAFGERLLAQSNLAYRPEVKRTDATTATGGGGSGNGNGSRAYYAVVVEDVDLLTLGGAPPPPPGSRSRTRSVASSDHDGLSHFKRAAQMRAAAANVPQPPSSVNPYKLMPTQVFSGSDDVLLEDAPLPPPRPPGNPPRMVPRELFEDGQQTT